MTTKRRRAAMPDRKVGLMGKQMEGDSKARRAAARQARESGQLPSESGLTQGASKQRHHLTRQAESDERLANIQRGEAKDGGPDVPRPLRGKGRRK